MTCIIDKKTGKVAPWTALQTGAYSLLDTAAEFTEEGHWYALDGQVLPSVTTILKAEGFIDSRWFDEWSREKGSMVHLATHYDDMGELDEESLDPVIIPYVEAWRRFKKESGFDVSSSEVPMASKTYRFAGKPDTIGEFPGGRIKRAAVELHDDGTYRLITYEGRQDQNVFLAALACYQWKRNNLKGA
jgi:hypothetical protein